MVSISLEGLTGDSDSTGRERRTVTGAPHFSTISPLRGYMIIHTTFLEQTFSPSKLFLLKQQYSVKSVEAKECYIEWREAVTVLEEGSFQLDT